MTYICIAGRRGQLDLMLYALARRKLERVPCRSIDDWVAEYLFDDYCGFIFLCGHVTLCKCALSC